MFKLVVLSALLAVAAARPGLLHSSPSLVYSSPLVQEHGLAGVGSIVRSVPTAISHQGSSIIHSSGHLVQPIVAPVLKTYSAPVLHTSIASPLAYSAPHLSYAASPLRIASPYGYTSGGW